MAPLIGQDVASLVDLAPLLRAVDGFDAALAELASGGSCSFDGVWGSARALVSAAVSRAHGGPVVVVLPRMKEVDEFAYEVQQFLGALPSGEEDANATPVRSPLVFPAWDGLPQERNVSDAVFGSRLRVLSELANASDAEDGSPIVITSVPALLQPVPSRGVRAEATRTLRVGEDVDPDEFTGWLSARGFDRVPAIRLPGEYAVRGGIVDVFPPDAVDPLRIEFFGDEVESLRRFDAETQRKLEELDDATLTVLAPDGGDESATKVGREHFCDVLPESAVVLVVELDEVVSEGKLYLSRLEDDQHREAGLFTVQGTLAKFARFGMATLAGLSVDRGSANLRLPFQPIDRPSGPKSEALAEFLRSTDSDDAILFACHNAAEQERLAELLTDLEEDLGAASVSRVKLCTGSVSQGFRFGTHRLVIVGDNEVFGRTHVRRSVRRSKQLTRSIDTFLDLKEGDLVVHLAQGIGRFRGMRLLEKDEKVEEHLIVEFKGGVTVFVPVSLIHLVQKYVGGAKADPELSKLGGTSWSKKKDKVADAVADMASDMLQVQALREAKEGRSCPPDSEWQREFDAVFPYTETDDQLRAIEEVKADLMRQQPMDRLICGDVGYGKTEVAMRAAFKTVDAGRQVAVLVPTTVLAEQHFRSFSDRMAEFPVSIACLSRFKTKKQQRKILDSMANGTVDIVIGTHRLVQKDVQFQNLGLVVIDEEQRFGVGHKERLKKLRLEVDVLTMTATPIPRTLHLSLLGVRDISSLQTPPQDRLAVETRVVAFDEDLIRRAIVREMNRGGQVYFVHNRVHNIERIASLVRGIVPEARVAVGHGQMKEGDLEAAMTGFVRGEFDVFVSTTIIESGLDIPSANTILINNAGHFGLAELHQLRGRVGRDKHRAYCYLLLGEGQTLTPDAKRRLRAIEEYSELGAGFKIAMRDLEIRGAGNILGTQQSGHIASVGYELYCQLLENAVRQMKGLPPKQHQHVTVDLSISGFIPDNYIPVARQKVEIYRKLSLVNSEQQLTEIENELDDRFGTPPQSVRRLLSRKELQLRAWSWGVEKLWIEDRYLVMQYRDAKRIAALAGVLGDDLKIVDAKRAYWFLKESEATQEALLDVVLPLFPQA